MTKWEYKQVILEGPRIEAKLNILGNAGWLLISGEWRGGDFWGILERVKETVTVSVADLYPKDHAWTDEELKAAGLPVVGEHRKAV